MAQVMEVGPVAGVKRSAEKPTKAVSTPVAKKPRISTDIQPVTQSPIVSTPFSIERRLSRAPLKVIDGRPLPTTPVPQSTNLSDAQYQSIAASAVLQASFVRSQAKWTHEGLFERYWVKPETGKNAKPPPPNNPDPKWQKVKGECRIRIEPHIFQCTMYVEEKPMTCPPRPPKQYMAPAGQGLYGQQYRAQQYTPQQPYQQNRTHTPIAQAGQSRNLPTPGVSRTTTPTRAPQPSPQDKKPGPDPVISKLAARASSDPELKSLMKEVATGNASQDQLKVFQRHIDELQQQIKQEKEAEAKAKASEDVIQYDGPADFKPNQQNHVTGQQYTPQPQAQQRPATQPYTPTQRQPVAPAPYQPPQAQKWIPEPAPARHAVILAFNTPGAIEDRFLFPQYSILESLSKNHLLASFLVTRKGRHAADTGGLDPVKEYWQPVTLMLEVKFGLEELPEFVKKWVKPADEVRKHMEAVMARSERAPESHLMMRLPVKAAAPGDVTENSAAIKEITPVSSAVDEKARSKPNIKYVKKATAPKSTPSATPVSSAKKPVKKPSLAGATAGKDEKKPSTPVTVEAEKEQKATASANVDGEAKTAGAPAEREKTESGRPKRAVRKSVRISEGYGMPSLLSRLGLYSATAVAGYAIILGLLLTPQIQRFALYAYKINTLFLGDDLYDGEAFGFAKGQVVPFWLSAGQERLFAWCVLANDVYARDRPALVAGLDRRPREDGVVGDFGATRAFELLRRGDARVVTLRTSSYRLLVSQPNTHVLAIDYRGFGLSTGSPTEAGLIADGTALLDWLMNVVGVPPERIVILGQSLGTAVGSAVALNFAEPGSGLVPAEAQRKGVREPVVFKGVVLVAPFSSLPSLLLTYRIGGILPILLPLRPFPWLAGMLTREWRIGGVLLRGWRPVATTTTKRLTSGDGEGGRMGSLQIFHSRRDKDISVAQTGMICERMFEGEEGKGVECVDGSVGTGVLDVERHGRVRVRIEVLEFGGHNRIITHTPVAIGILRAFEDLWD
ncbi:hypothetical protein Tdes44962_MAKER04080 [Teratosphaeria destructans]|uniref:AB hydrolase-1 domain-containing protein n=1 Tax=Teratosphaeria destructans TaxID=418781 RepID=A0A9W7W0D5_9PEZI|nr:hypothetical protein Tdes44962_MAKER04080 [Teratosphaeria destructans]